MPFINDNQSTGKVSYNDPLSKIFHDTSLFGDGTKSVPLRVVSVRLKGYTVATLPSGVIGDTAYVTNALSPTFNSIVAGGGSVVTKVFYNGTNWIVG